MRLIVLLIILLLSDSLVAQDILKVYGQYPISNDTETIKVLDHVDFVPLRHGRRAKGVLYDTLGTYSRKSLRSMVACLEYNGQMYINVERHGLIGGFVPVVLDGKYKVLYAGLTKSSRNSRMAVYTLLFSSFGIIGSGFGANLRRIPYLVDPNTGALSPLTYDYVLQVLSPYPDLVERLASDGRKRNYSLQIELLGKANERIGVKH